MIDPGERISRLTYQEATSVISSVGQPILTWSDVLPNIFARLRPLNGRESFWAQQIHSAASHEVNIRWHPAIKPTGRFVVSGTTRVLNIVSVLDYESRQIELTVMCTEAIPSEG